MKSALVVLLVVGVSVPAFAAGARTMRHSARGNMAKAEMVKGEVESVNIEAQTFTVKEHGKDIQVSWSDNTKVEQKAGRGKQWTAVSPADIATGEKISARTEKEPNGTLMAQSIWIRTPSVAQENSKK